MSVCLYCAGLGHNNEGKKCSYCKGTGCNQSAPFKPADVCPKCNGRGKVTTKVQTPECTPCSAPETWFVRCACCAGTGKKP